MAATDSNFLFFFSWSGDHRDLHSFPTRRSSDLSCGADRAARIVLADSVGHGVAASLIRSEEHTSELQSQFHLVCRLLLEKKKNCSIAITAGAAAILKALPMITPL